MAKRYQRASPAQEPDTGSAARRRLEKMYAHHAVLWRLCRRMGLSPEAAADAAQQAYVIAAERLDGILPGKERAFLLGVAFRLARSARRNGNRYDLTESMDDRPHPGEAAKRLAARHAAIQLMDRVLSSMDDDLVAVLTLCELEGMSGPEVASTLGLPAGTVASRLRRARQRFRARARQLEPSTSPSPTTETTTE